MCVYWLQKNYIILDTAAAVARVWSTARTSIDFVRLLQISNDDEYDHTTHTSMQRHVDVCADAAHAYPYIQTLFLTIHDHRLVDWLMSERATQILAVIAFPRSEKKCVCDQAFRWYRCSQWSRYFSVMNRLKKIEERKNTAFSGQPKKPIEQVFDNIKF